MAHDNFGGVIDVKKEKKKRLTILQRVEIIERLDAGEREVNLAREYGVSQAAISRTKLKKDSILSTMKTIDEHGDSSKKKITGIEDTLLDKELYRWYNEIISHGETVCGSALQQKALVLNRLFGGPENFKASNGWLHRWKIRHNIHRLVPSVEQQSDDERGGGVFADNFLQSIENKHYERDCIYNADEMGLIWKSLPTKTLVTSHDKCTLGQNMVKDRITVMVCSNATGTHKIPLLMIGKIKNPRCFKPNNVLPVVYKAQHNGRMDPIIFEEWYEQIFIPEILQKHGPNAKCILLIDNAPSHPPAEKLNLLSNMCTVMCSPPNVTSQINPMNQGVIERIKKTYKRCFLEHLLLTHNVEEIEKSLKNWNLLMCGNILAYAWNSVSEINLKTAWNNLLTNKVIESPSDQMDTDDFVRLLRQVCNDNNITTECAMRWLQDESDSLILEEEYEAQDSTRKGEQVGAEEALMLLDRFQKFYQTCAGCTVDDVLDLERFRTIVTNSIVYDRCE